MVKATGSDVERMVVTRVFEAPRELVWKAWTDPTYVKQWWGPKGCSSPSCQIDLRVGGKFLYAMQLPDGQVFWNGGVYYEIVPHEKIVFSLYFADAQGNRVEAAEVGIEHEAIEGARDTVLFQDLGAGRTKVTLIGNESMESARASGQLEGTEQMLDKTTAVVAELVALGKGA